MLVRKKLIGLVILIVLSSAAHAQSSNNITGAWLTADEDGNHDSVVEIFQEGNTYVGEVRWIRRQVYPEGDRMAGQPIVDRENPDPALRQRSVMNIRVLSGFTYEDGEWVNGKTYDVRKGKVYSAQMKLVDANTLKLRGYIGTPLLGQSVIWTRSPIPPLHLPPR